MELTRIIHPIGQGGFYTETLKDGDDEINVVYDCGGNSKAFMQNYLDPKKKNVSSNIDAVFISHFHDDHINGLEYLLNNYKVKYLFLPQMSEEAKYMILLYYIAVSKIKYNTKNILTYSFLIKILFGILDNGNAQVIWVESTPKNFITFNNNYYDIKNISLPNNILPFNSVIHFHDKWFYIPYNPPAPTINGKSVKQCFEDKFGVIEFQKIPELFKATPKGTKDNNIKECKKIYSDCFGDGQNPSSMTLFSGCKNSKFYYLGVDCFKNNDNPNCMYIGDFEEKYIDGLILRYGEHWKTIATIQVPHHGSNENNSDKLYQYAYRGFISVRRKHKNHPGNQTMITMEEKRCQSLIVTENPSSKKIFHYTDENDFDSNQESKRTKNDKSSESKQQTDELGREQKSMQEPTAEMSTSE